MSARNIPSASRWSRSDDVYRELLAISFVPFLTGLLRYGLLASTGHGEVPERELFQDPVLLVAGLSWAALVGAGLYLP
ncbi:hypothetical protein AB0E63_35000 [Kribbella sp. NPDC026596]|uniref:hypothetical protein n=1 Tax=Kribbella sp. NPDC026596 TaxID=3155122 RepID=UPI0033D75B75